MTNQDFNPFDLSIFTSATVHRLRSPIDLERRRTCVRLLCSRTELRDVQHTGGKWSDTRLSFSTYSTSWEVTHSDVYALIPFARPKPTKEQLRQLRIFHAAQYLPATLLDRAECFDQMQRAEVINVLHRVVKNQSLELAPPA